MLEVNKGMSIIISLIYLIACILIKFFKSQVDQGWGRISSCGGSTRKSWQTGGWAWRKGGMETNWPLFWGWPTPYFPGHKRACALKRKKVRRHLIGDTHCFISRSFSNAANSARGGAVRRRGRTRPFRIRSVVGTGFSTADQDVPIHQTGSNVLFYLEILAP